MLNYATPRSDIANPHMATRDEQAWETDGGTPLVDRRPQRRATVARFVCPVPEHETGRWDDDGGRTISVR